MPYLLPSRHRFAYDLSIFYHDVILGLLQASIESGLFQLELNTTSDEEAVVRELEGEELYVWLEANRSPDFIAEVNYCSCIPALLADFCPFILHALRAWAKGHMTLTYALLRKPLKDNLFYLEWLLADPADFMGRFVGRDAEHFEQSRLTPERREAIVCAAGSAANATLTDAKLVHDLRYDRAKPNGLAGVWDQASHLVTNYKAIRTEPQNFNFVFSGDDARESQGDHLQGTLPYLLYHALCVVWKLLGSLGEPPADYTRMKQRRRDAGYSAWAWEVTWPRVDPVPALPAGLALPDCPECGSPIVPDLRNLRSFAVRGTGRCKRCAKPVRLDPT